MTGRLPETSTRHSGRACAVLCILLAMDIDNGSEVHAPEVLGCVDVSAPLKWLSLRVVKVRPCRNAPNAQCHKAAHHVFKHVIPIRPRSVVTLRAGAHALLLHARALPLMQPLCCCTPVCVHAQCPESR